MKNHLPFDSIKNFIFSFKSLIREETTELNRFCYYTKNLQKFDEEFTLYQ